MSDIPPELFPKILTLLPAQSLLRFRCVCKPWRRIIDDPDFTKAHRHYHWSSTTGADQLILREDSGTLYSLPLESLACSVDGSHKTAIAIHRPLMNHGPRLNGLPAPSCDGMFLHAHFEIDKVWTLWSPFSRKFHVLPPYDDLTDMERRCGMPSSGFGYDCVTDDYKVVRIVELYRSHNLETLVYSMKLGFWRRINGLPNCQISMHCSLRKGHGVFAHGALHWLVDMKQQGKYVCTVISLDLGTEICSLLPLPPAIADKEELSMKAIDFSNKYLDVLSGCFCLSYFNSIGLDVWMMEDYGGDKTWIKMFSCTRKHIYATVVKLRVVAYLKSQGLVLLNHNREDFFWFDVEKNSVRKVSIDGFRGSFSSQVCSPSLFRLDDGDDIDHNIAAKRKPGQKKKPHNKRLKLTVETDVWHTNDNSEDSDYSDY